jgi:DNA repair protein RecO
MGYLYTQGIVINTEPLNEKDKIVVLISRELGKINVKFRAVRASKSKRSGFSDDFIYEKILLYKKQNFFTATEVSLIDSYSELKNSYDDYKTLTYIKEFLLTLLPYEQAEPEVFDLLVVILNCLKTTKFKQSATIYFCMHLLKLLGTPILLPRSVKGEHYFSPQIGGFNRKNGTKIANSVVEDFLKIYYANPCEFNDVLDSASMFDLINNFVLYHTDSEEYKNFLKAFSKI